MDQLSVPTTEQFKALAETWSRFEFDFRTGTRQKIYDISDANGGELTSATVDVNALAIELKEIGDKAHDAALLPEAGIALNWLENQPSFQLALRSLGYYQMPDGWLPIFEDTIANWLSIGAYPENLTYRIVRRYGSYIRFASGVAQASHRYITKQAANEAIDGFRVLAEIRDRLAEVERLVEHPSTPDSARNIWKARSVKRAVDRLNEECLLGGAVSRRNDADLPARLMAVEIIQLNWRVTGAAQKRAVFHLMGLPFVQSELEMRTIERLVKAEKERTQKRWSRQKDGDIPASSDVTP